MRPDTTAYHKMTTDSRYGCGPGNAEERYVKVALQLTDNNIEKVKIFTIIFVSRYCNNVLFALYYLLLV